MKLNLALTLVALQSSPFLPCLTRPCLYTRLHACLDSPSSPLHSVLSAPAVPFLLVMSHPPYHICPQRNAPRLPDLNSPCITFRLASLTHLACVPVPFHIVPRHNGPLHACRALTIHCPSVQNSPYRCTHSMPAKILRAFPCQSSPFHSTPAKLCHAIPHQSLPCLPMPCLHFRPRLAISACPVPVTSHLNSPCLPLQSLPDPDAPRQPASAIPCLLCL